VIRPPHIGAFEFVVLASLRTAQLTRGCTPRVPAEHKHIVTAQREIAAGLVTIAPPRAIGGPPRLDSAESPGLRPDEPSSTGALMRSTTDAHEFLRPRAASGDLPEGTP
jgi:hypothetical protein